MGLYKKGVVAGVVLVLIGFMFLFSGTFVIGADGDSKDPTSIPDFMFEKNSDWNNAFDILDYYELSGHPSGYSFSEDPTNVDGEFVDRDFTIGGGVRFKPAVDFVGARNFQLNVQDVMSNVFKVTIVEDLGASINAASETGEGGEIVKYGSQSGVSGGMGLIVWVVIVIIVVLLAGFAFWFFKLRKKDTLAPEVATIPAKNTATSAISSSKIAPVLTKKPSQDAINDYYKKNKIK